MNELVTYETYEQFKVALDTEILSAAESFVKIGWLLKQARDTNILYESGYANLYEFAKAEYGIDKGTVSRFIAINDRFSVNGNAPVLEDKYSGRGVAKLQEMLTLSDEVIEVIPEQTTKAELQEIKRDIKAEEEITDLEVMLEEPEIKAEELNNLAKKSLYQLLKDDKDTFKRVCEAFSEQLDEHLQERLLKALAPSGIATPRVRFPQVGTILMSIQGLDHDIQFVNVRTNERESQGWGYIQDTLYLWIGMMISTGTPAEERYEELYGEKFEEVAPVQPIIEKGKSEDEEKQESEKQKEKEFKDEESSECHEVQKEAENVENIIAEPHFEEVQQQQPKNEQKNEVKKPENVENIIAETDFEENEQKSGVEMPENAENIIADADFREVENDTVTSEQHNTFMKIAEDIKEALRQQDYKLAQFKARKLAEILEFAEDEEDE